MKKISFFAPPPYVFRNYLRRVSSILRGEQMAAYMQNARLNPSKGYEKDICIYVKPHVKPGDDFTFEGHPYLDIVDGFDLIHLLRKHPEVSVIVFSDLDVETMSSYVQNKIICIPHQHINFERAKRTRNIVQKIGIVGSQSAFGFIPDEIRKGLVKRRMELVEHSLFYPRMSVVKFYQSFDVQLVWRPYYKQMYRRKPYKILANPFKIVNTSAFGVPTIALDEPAFAEMTGCYIPVQTVEEFFAALDNLRSDPQMYAAMSKVCLEKSERYHIENIAKLYYKL